MKRRDFNTRRGVRQPETFFQPETFAKLKTKQERATSAIPAQAGILFDIQK